MFLPLEENDLVHMGRIVALVRDESETAIILQDGSVMATGFTPRTLARRYAELLQLMTNRAPHPRASLPTEGALTRKPRRHVLLGKGGLRA